jgi:hypothetical protein
MGLLSVLSVLFIGISNVFESRAHPSTTVERAAFKELRHAQLISSVCRSYYREQTQLNSHALLVLTLLSRRDTNGLQYQRASRDYSESRRLDVLLISDESSKHDGSEKQECFRSATPDIAARRKGQAVAAL